MPRGEPHDTVRWALQARNVRDHYLPERAERGSALVLRMVDVMVFLGVSELVKEIELTLKQRVERFYRSTVGEDWWDQLPAPVRRNARTRRRWAVEQIGRRRVLGETNIAWLSFGDVVRVLSEFPTPAWQKCLDAESQRQAHFEHALRRVKAFRDYHLAHPKPRAISTSELAAVCSSVERLPAIIRPTEWAEVARLLELVAAAPLEDRKLLNHLANDYPEPDEDGLKAWFACPTLHNPCTCEPETRLGRRGVTWRVRLVTYCGRLDPGGHLFFGLQ